MGNKPKDINIYREEKRNQLIFQELSDLLKLLTDFQKQLMLKEYYTPIKKLINEISVTKIEIKKNMNILKKKL